jgi:hypothetical protein
MTEEEFLKIVKKDFVTGSIHISDIEVMSFRSYRDSQNYIMVKVYWKIQTLATQSLRSALQGMKE